MGVGIDGAMTTREAAQLLDVTQKQIEHLVRAGRIPRVATGLVDAQAVRRHQIQKQGTHTRGWSHRTAWAAVALLSDYECAWIGQPQRSRLGGRLRVMDTEQLIASARNRALVGNFAGHATVVDALHADSRTVSGRPLPGMVAGAAVSDWYVAGRHEQEVVTAYGLLADSAGDLVLRRVDTAPHLGFPGINLGDVEDLLDRGVLPALDAATSLDPRESGVAKRLLDVTLDRFRRRG